MPEKIVSVFLRLGTTDTNVTANLTKSNFLKYFLNISYYKLKQVAGICSILYIKLCKCRCCAFA